MLIRALIVVLAILNLGVAAWWMSRPDANEATVPLQPAGVPRLQLPDEAASVSASPVAPSTMASSVPTTRTTQVAPPNDAPALPVAPKAEIPAAAANRCYALGPFADAAAANAAAANAAALATRVREEPGTANAYSVVLPPAADRAAAQAIAQRIGAAGFDDYLVINTGEQANGIALGRYRSRESAQRRQTALQAAGFAAQLQPVGQVGAAKWWADVSVAADARVASARSIDCAALR